jgi:AcrR family transcriptional regulator
MYVKYHAVLSVRECATISRVSEGAAKPGRRGRPPRLTRAEIVSAARRVLEREGVGALTMRRVAREVGSAPMGLYHHVADKDELLLALLEEEAASLEPPPLPADPRARIVTVARFLRDVLDERPWVLQAIRPGERFGPGALPLVEEILAGFVACGLTPERAALAYRALWFQITGELTVRHARTRIAPPAGAEQPRPAAGEADAAPADGSHGFAEATMRALDPQQMPLLSALGERWWQLADSYDPSAALAALVDGLIARGGG